MLVPSNELVNQVHQVAKFISHHVKLRVEKVSGALGWAAWNDMKSGPIDVAIGTPAQLTKSQLPLMETNIWSSMRVTLYSLMTLERRSDICSKMV